MTLQQQIVTQAAVGVGVARTPDGLSAIHHPGCAAAIWQRIPDVHFQRWLDALPVATLPRARMILPAHVVRETLSDLVEEAGMPGCQARDMLVDDIAALADIFATLMKSPYLRLRLDAISTNACRKFHIYAITARLICTYRGTGTQYGVSPDGSEPNPICTVPTGAPMIMRGTKWPGGQPSGLLHRSPPIEGTGETRLVLVLDPVPHNETASGPHRLH